MISPLETTTPAWLPDVSVLLELHRLEHEEQVLAVAIHLRSLIRVHGILDGQFV